MSRSVTSSADSPRYGGLRPLQEVASAWQSPGGSVRLNRRDWLARCMSASALCLWPRSRIQAAGEWIDFRESGRFQVRSEFPLRREAALESFLADLTGHESDILATLGLARTDHPVLISVFASRRSYLRTVEQEAPEGLRRQAIFIRGEELGRVFVYESPALLTDLRHETTHAVLHSGLPFVPLWLDEGLAEYFEPPVSDRPSDHPHLEKLKWSARFGWKPDLRRLENQQSAARMSVGDYRESWAWVHFLLHSDDALSDLLRSYLQQIENQCPPGPLSDHLARRLPAPERALLAHLKNWR